MKLILPLAVFALGLFLATLVARAQLPAINFEVITTRNGLPSNTVLSATRDRKGFMWFGTRLCPVRYDGVSFKIFTEYTTNFVTGVRADEENNIWFSSDRSGISMIEGTNLHMRKVSNEKGEDEIATGDFFIDRYGVGWYSDHFGINSIDLDSHVVRHYAFRQSSYVWPKASFVEDADSNLWVIGRDNGLFKYDRRADTLVCVLGADSNISSAYRDLVMSGGVSGSDGYLWLATYNYGLLKFDTDRYVVESYATGRQANQLLSVEEGEDENGRRILWVGDDQSLGIFRPDEERFYFFEDILPRSYEVFDIYRDHDKIVWACTSEGIIKYHPAGNMIQTIPIPNSLSQDGDIMFIHQDNRIGKEHIFFMGLSNNGFLVWNRITNTFERIEYPAVAAETKWIQQNDDGKLWIGTNRWDYRRPGIFLFDPATSTFSQNNATRKANTFFSVPFFMYGLLDGDRLWVGNSDEGIHTVDMAGREVTPWSADKMNRLVQDNNLVNDMALDNTGRLWVGTYSGTFLFHETERTFKDADPQELPDAVDDQTVNSLLPDGKNNVWAARWGSLTRTSEKKMSLAIGTKEGFNDREIKGLALDHAGNVWVGNHEGLYCYQVNENKLIRFTMNDGLISNNTSNRIFSTNDQRELIVGQSTGFNIIKVDALAQRADAPQLVITSFKIHQTDFPAAATGVTLAPDQNVFSVDFVALNYRKQDDNRYAYFLEGFEDDWNYIDSRHIAYYTNLNPGKYMLHMKSSDSHGNWNTQELQLPIEVLPAFYQTAWFRILVALLVGGTLYAFYRYRINQLLRLQQVRNGISADLHDELGSTLSGISIMGTLAKKQLSDPVTSGALVDRIMEDVRQISGSLDDIVWNISPKNDSLASLVARMTRYSSELFEAKQINFQLKIPDDVDKIRLSMEQRRNIYLIFKESVNNLVKYSGCSQASVSVSVIDRYLHLTVTDNGIGFEPNTPTDRNGLRNLQDRARILKARIDIRSSHGEGTCISIVLPVPG